MSNPRVNIELKCDGCGVVFTKSRHRHNRSMKQGMTRHFHSRECSNAHLSRLKPVTLQCDHCGISFIRSGNQHKKARARGVVGSYHSSGCANAAKNKGGHIERKGYRLVMGRRNGVWSQYREHILVWEAANGPLQPGENVHHINRNKLDNRLENLEMWCTSQPSGARMRDLLVDKMINDPQFYSQIMLAILSRKEKTA